MRTSRKVLLVSSGLCMAASAIPASGADPVRCQIEVQRASGGVQLRALATASSPFDGSYLFKVDKTGPGGTSTTGQSGDFRLNAGEKEVLGDVTISVERGGSIVAELTLQWPGGSVSCLEGGAS